MSALQMIALGKKAANLYGALCAPICKKYGVNQTGFDVLLFCANNPDHNTARDLCALRGLKSGIASVAVESLIQGGLLVRTEDPLDRRMHRLVPTDAAAALIEEGRRMQRVFTNTLRAGISEEDLAAFTRVTDALEANLAAFGGKDPL